MKPSDAKVRALLAALKDGEEISPERRSRTLSRFLQSIGLPEKSRRPVGPEQMKVLKSDPSRFVEFLNLQSESRTDILMETVKTVEPAKESETRPTTPESEDQKRTSRRHFGKSK